MRGLTTTRQCEDVWDSSFTGGAFGVRVYKSGTKKFTILYRNRFGEQKRLMLGTFPAMTLAEARDKARKTLVEVGEGHDPAQARADHRAAETFSQLCELYLTLHAAPNKKPASYREDKRIITHDLLPAWRLHKACDIRRRDVIALLDSIRIGRRAPVLANRCRALIHKLFNFALEREIVQANPCAGLPRVAREKRRERVLSDAEIQALWRALGREDVTVASLFKMILLTAQRPGEVKAMRWSDIQGELWTIPADVAKNGRTHRVPLSPAALRVLRAVREHNEARFERSRKPADEKAHYLEYVFPSRTGGATAWLHKASSRLRKAVGGEAFTPHDLRRTAATGMAQLGTSRDVISKLLNHLSSDNLVTGIYDRYDRMPEMAAALSKWGMRVDKLVHPLQVVLRTG